MRASLALVAVLLGAGAARAAEPVGRGKVALFPVEGDAQLGSRVNAELVAQGFEPQLVSSPAASGSFDDLRTTMRKSGAELAIRIVMEPKSVRLWIVNAATGKQVYREVVLAQGSSADSAVVSLWAVEALRASGLPRTPASAAASPPAPAAAPEPAPASWRSAAPRLSLQLSPALALSPGALGATAHLALAARLSVTRKAGAELMFVAPTLPAELAHTYGQASVWRSLVAGGAFLTTGGADSRAALDVAAGATLLVTYAQGAGSEGFSGSTDTLISGGPYAKVGGSFGLSPRWRLRTDAASGVALPRPVVYFANERVATWGRPWFLLSLGTEVAF